MHCPDWRQRNPSTSEVFQKIWARKSSPPRSEGPGCRGAGVSGVSGVSEAVSSRQNAIYAFAWVSLPFLSLSLVLSDCLSLFFEHTPTHIPFPEHKDLGDSRFVPSSLLSLPLLVFSSSCLEAISLFALWMTKASLL